AYTKDESNDQILEVTYLPLYMPAELATPTTKRIAVRSVGETSGAYNQFYTATTDLKATLPLTMDMIFDLVPVNDNENTKFYLKRAFEDDKYVQADNAASVGSLSADPAQFEICNITTIETNQNNKNKHQFDKSNVHSGYTDTYIQTYGVRFAKADDAYLNVNSAAYPSGTGIWSVQLAVDASCYRKYTLNITRHDADGNVAGTESITSMQRVGDDIELPAYFGYIYNGDPVVKDETDTQVIDIVYNAMNYEAAELAPGSYFIYYTDDNDTKHYLQTNGENNVITVTEEPMFYDIQNGAAGGLYAHSYFLKMNDLRISNTVYNNTQISTSTNNRTYESQVFFQTEEIPDRYAIRLTNVNAATTEWHENYFIGKGEQYGTTTAVNPNQVAPQDRYIWQVEPVMGEAALNLRNCLRLVRETYCVNGEWLLRDGVNYYNAALLDVYNEALEFYNSITEDTPEADIEAMFNKLEAERDATQINQPEFNKFYRIRCCDESQTTPYVSVMQAAHTTTEQRFTMVSLDSNDPNTIFYYYNENDDANDDSDEGTHLISLSKGRSIECHDFVAVGNTSNVAFYPAANGVFCQYNISFTSATHGYGQRYIYGAQTHNRIDGGNSNPPSTGGMGYNWQLEEVTALPVVITSAGYATLYSPVALTLPENGTLEAYYANATTATDMKLTEITGGVIPAETGVILKGEAGTYMLTVGGEGSIGGTNLLHGTIIPEYIDGEIYVLAQTASGAGMAKAQQIEEGEHAGKVINNGFKAYLPASSVITAETRFFSFNFGGGDETGIESMDGVNGQHTVIYDLSGRRVQNAVKGLYIVDGKKMVK
ncbi:MAG: hypothetical protein K2J00_01230, partial [Bacteroidaceae bacterium]|nr:hypothetical protein [Bacteroidaceae bacterium]